MAAAVRFSKAERDFIIQALTVTRNDKEEKLRTSIVDKLERSEMVKGKGKAPGIGWVRAVNAMRAAAAVSWPSTGRPKRSPSRIKS